MLRGGGRVQQAARQFGATPTSSYGPAVDVNARLGILFVRRDRASRGRRLNWGVDIDGERVGQLHDGERLSWNLSPGRHEIRVGGSECVVDVSEGRFVELRARLPDSAKGWARPMVEVERWGPSERRSTRPTN